MNRAPAVVIIETLPHEWNYGGYCIYCDRDRFGRDGLRDDEQCPARRTP